MGEDFGLDRLALIKLVTELLTPASGLSPVAIVEIATAVAAAIDENNRALRQELESRSTS
jgi:hypothetical protein